jgi:hypothetical protein
MTMRLIDAEPWAESIQKDFCDGCDNYGGVRCSCCKVEDILVALEEAPTIEAKPVVCAHWEKPTYINGRAFSICHCSACEGIPCGIDENTKYCPNCGAQMDEGVKIPVISMEDVPKLMEEMEK